jgi:D-3-phosphoglycerate dehydrogenase / 2-oxoglutarate reductase
MIPHTPDTFLENKTLIFDFDSTLIRKEGLEELAILALAQLPPSERTEILSQIQVITNLGMEGKIGFAESLERRMKMLQDNLTVDVIHHLAADLTQHISPFFHNYQGFMKRKATDIYVLSGGFEEFIGSTTALFEIPKEHIFANSFLCRKNKIIGYDTSRPAAKNDGKVELLAQLQLDPETTVVIGDGSTDRRMKESGLAKYFFAFTENIERPGIHFSHQGEVIADGTHHELGVLVRSYMELC